MAAALSPLPAGGGGIGGGLSVLRTSSPSPLSACGEGERKRCSGETQIIDGAFRSLNPTNLPTCGCDRTVTTGLNRFLCVHTDSSFWIWSMRFHPLAVFTEVSLRKEFDRCCRSYLATNSASRFRNSSSSTRPLRFISEYASSIGDRCMYSRAFSNHSMLSYAAA